MIFVYSRETHWRYEGPPTRGMHSGPKGGILDKRVEVESRLHAAEKFYITSSVAAKERLFSKHDVKYTRNKRT